MSKGSQPQSVLSINNPQTPRPDSEHSGPGADVTVRPAASLARSGLGTSSSRLSWTRTRTRTTVASLAR
eukprot:1329493-Rhodomonas_salina.1